MTMGNTNARGRIWFITGASSGFGRAVSEAALKRGDSVVATGRDLQGLEALFDSRAERALPLRLDITDAGAGGAYYAASKFAIEGFSESLAGEVAHLGIKVTIIEPGPARTRFLEDRSAKWAKPIPDYAASVGKTRAMLRELNGKQPVDPARAACAIVEAVEADEPPLHLPLGHLALEHIRNEFSDRLGKLDTWRQLSATADFAS